MKIEREIIQHPNASMRCTQLRQSGFRGGLHRHAHVELTWIERGRGLRWVGDSVEPFSDGDVVLVGPELAHVWLTGQGGGPRSCAATVLQFPSNWAAATGLPELRGLEVLMRRASRGLAIEGRLRPKVQALMTRMSSADGPNRAAHLIELLALMNKELGEGSLDLRSLSVQATPADAEGSAFRLRRQRVDRLLRWVQAHLGDDLSVSDAAAIAGISAAAFGRFFRREVGKSFIEFINDARCSWAALRLLESTEPVAEIALSCGYASLSNFGEHFRRRYQVSPREYRRQALRASQ